MLTPLTELPEWYEFRLRYQSDIFAFATEVLGMDVTWQQEQLFDSIRFGGSRTTVSSGHGCFGLGTKVMRASGEIANVEDIREGDALMGDDGKSVRNVLELKRGQQAMYRFTYSDGTSHEFNESHILCLVATNSHFGNPSGTRFEVSVHDWLKWSKNKKRCHAIYRSAVTNFHRKQSVLPIDPYILGIWLGDGHTKSTAVTTEDPEIKAALAEYAQSIGCDLTKHGDTGNAETLNISKALGRHGKKNPMRESLRELGIFELKNIPQEYMLASLEDRKQLLAGLIDTDGFLDKAGYDIVQKNKQLAHQIAWLARSIGCHSTLREVTKKCCNNGVSGQYWRVTIGRNICNIPVRIARKKAFFNPNGRNNLHFSIKHVEPLGEGNYYGFTLDGNRKFLGGDFTVLRNTGKTRSMAVVALWHLLCFENSVTMFTAPQIQQLRNQTWKEIALCFTQMKNGKYSWLCDYVKILTEKVYIVGRSKEWHVLAKTAPKNAATNIAGQHGDNLLIWADEASGVENAVMETLMGALTHEDNRMVLTSQPTKGSGFFYDTHHSLSFIAGGVWVNITMNSELSPIVSEKWLKEQLQKYGSRDDPVYQIRVLGIFPDLTGEFIVPRRLVEAMYGKKTCIGKKREFGYVMCVDVGGGVGRDDSVIAIGKVSGDAHHGEDARRVDIIDIPLIDNTSEIDRLLSCIDEQMAKYPNITLVLDANGAGRGLAQALKARGIYFMEVHWGGQCFDQEAKETYHNKRSQAIVCMSRAVGSGRLRMHSDIGKNKLLDQVARIPYSFDDNSRWYVLPKESMRRRGLKSPDVADVLAFFFLDGVMYTPANDEYYNKKDDELSESTSALEALAAQMLA